MGLFDQIANVGRQGLGLVGSGLQKAGAALGGSQPSGTPGINPAAPDPRQQQGLGLAQPKPAVGSGGDGLGDLPFVTRLVLALDDGLKHNEGMLGEGDRLRQQRAQAAEQRRVAWKQNVEVVDKFRAFLDTVPITERESRAAKLKQKYVSEFGGPGSEDLFDTIVGAGGDGEAISSQLLDDPEIQAVLANNPRASMADINSIRQSPQFIQRAVERQDQVLLPSVEKKVSSLLGAQNPTMRDAIAKVQKDGKITPEEIKQLNEMAGEGPEGFKLTPGELSTLDRQQAAIAQRIPGFSTTEEFEASRKAEADLAKFQSEKALEDRLMRGRTAFEKSLELANSLELEKGKRALGPEPAKPSDVNSLRSQYLSESKDFTKYRDAAEGIEVAAKGTTGASDMALVYNFIKLMDPNAVKEGEYALTESAAQTIPEKYINDFNRLVGNKANRLSPDAKAEILEVARPMFESRVDTYKAIGKQFGDIAERQGMRRDDVVIDLRSPKAQQESKTAGKPKAVVQNGHTYTLNEETGEYE